MNNSQLLQFKEEAHLEAIAHIISVRKRSSFLLEAVVPLGTSFVTVLSRSAINRVSRRFAASQAAAGAAAITGLAATPAGSASLFTLAEAIAISYITASEVASVLTLWAAYPGADEASRFMPAASVITAIDLAYYNGSQDAYAKISREQAAYGVAYAIHFSQLPATAPDKVATLADLYAGYIFGYCTAPVAAFAARAQRSLAAYTCGLPEALIQRAAKDVGLLVKYSGGKLLSKLPTAMKLTSTAATAYNIGVTAYNTVASYCRLLQCPVASEAAQYAVDFMLSPSSYELTLPFRKIGRSDPVTPVHVIDLDKQLELPTQSVIQTYYNINNQTRELDARLEK